MSLYDDEDAIVEAPKANQIPNNEALKRLRTKEKIKQMMYQEIGRYFMIIQMILFHVKLLMCYVPTPLFAIYAPTLPFQILPKDFKKYELNENWILFMQGGTKPILKKQSLQLNT